jgi:hypothetical protein
MRTSTAAKRFATLNIIVTAMALGLLLATEAAWSSSATANAVGGDVLVKPRGSGWLAVVGASAIGSNGASVNALWFNPARAIIAGVVGLISALLAMWFVLAFVRWGSERAHMDRYRGEQRISAALLYSTAWLGPVFVAALILSIHSLAWIGEAAGWGWCPTHRTITLIAGVVASVSAVMWWFWLVRLSATAPPDTRGRVMGFFAIGSPLIAIGLTLCWWLGNRKLSDPVFDLLNMSF